MWLYWVGFAALLAPGTFFVINIPSGSDKERILFCALISSIAAFVSYSGVKAFSSYFFRRNLKGKDFGRRGTPDEHREIPSAVGLVSGIIFLVFVILAYFFTANFRMLADYNAALLSICFMILLGFVDDVLDLPWRYKLMLPTIASLPLLCNYYAYYSHLTTIAIPLPFRFLLVDCENLRLTPLGQILEGLKIAVVDIDNCGRSIDLGLLYLVYMGFLAVFATNAINIYAGINGLEVGQSVVIAVSVLTANIYELYAGAEGEHAYHHMFSLTLLFPFLGISIGLMALNVFPAKVFVGDTYCYFAGMTFAVCGILGHFSKTLLLFFVPQVINFVYSLPQLFKVYPCPRHRLPDFDGKSGLMSPSTFELVVKSPRRSNTHLIESKSSDIPTKVTRRVKRTSSSVSSIPMKVLDPQVEGEGTVFVERRDNMTLINLVLRILGPMPEERLTLVLLSFQAVVSLSVLVLRYRLAEVLFPAP